MNRRSFFKLIGGATVAIATSTLRAADLIAPVERAPRVLLLDPVWFQTKRTSIYYSPEYLAAVERIMTDYGKAFTKEYLERPN